MFQTDSVLVPRPLWEEIRKVLEARQFTSDGEDEDNDYEVIDVLEKMEKLDGGQG